MFLSSSARLIYSTVGNFKGLRSCICHATKNYVILSPKFNPGFPKGISVRLIRQCSPKLCISDAGDDNLEKAENMYFYQKLPRQENIARIMECTGCSKQVAVSVLRDYPVLKYVTSSEISGRITALNEKGVPKETIWVNYSLLAVTRDTLEEIVGILAELEVTDYNLAVSLLQFPVDTLRKTSSWCMSMGVEGKTKISYLRDKLKCDPAEIVLAVSVHKFLLNVPFERMAAILDILLAEQVPPSKILTDMWVFRYHVKQVRRRVKQAKEGGIKQFKTWMVRCTENVLKTTIRIQAEKKKLLGPHNYSMVDYISSRLKVSPVEAQYILRRHPQLRGVGAAKVRNTLDFLLGNEGDAEKGIKFDPILIWNSSRILCHSLDTMKARLARLRALGYEPKTPFLLYKTKWKFDKFIEKLEKQALEKSEEMKNLKSSVEKTSQASKTRVNG